MENLHIHSEFHYSQSAKNDRLTQSQNELGQDSSLDITAFVSCYNEEAIIEQTLSDVIAALKSSGLSFEIIIIDDCSSDSSVKIIKEYISQNHDDRIILRCNLVNNGLAQNYIDAAFLGAGRYYKLFCGDNTEPISSILTILDQIGVADIIIPIYSSVDGKNVFRAMLSRAYTSIINIVSGNSINYYNGLHVHRRINIMRWHPNTRGFGFQADILCMLLDRGASYKEISVPAINHLESRALNIKNILSVFHTVLDILIRRLSGVLYGR